MTALQSWLNVTGPAAIAAESVVMNSPSEVLGGVH